MNAPAPRTVTSVLAEVGPDSVTVTWGLGEPVDTGEVEFFGYGVYCYDPTGNGGKRLGVRFGGAVTAWVFDNASATQDNYDGSTVTATHDAVTVHFHDASLGLDAVGTIEAYAQVNGHDTQVELLVTLLQGDGLPCGMHARHARNGVVAGGTVVLHVGVSCAAPPTEGSPSCRISLLHCPRTQKPPFNGRATLDTRIGSRTSGLAGGSSTVATIMTSRHA